MLEQGTLTPDRRKYTGLLSLCGCVSIAAHMREDLGRTSEQHLGSLTCGYAPGSPHAKTKVSGVHISRRFSSFLRGYARLFLPSLPGQVRSLCVGLHARELNGDREMNRGITIPT